LIPHSALFNQPKDRTFVADPDNGIEHAVLRDRPGGVADALAMYRDDALLTDAEKKLDMGSLVPIQKGRKLVEQEIFSAAAQKVRVFGIELLDIRFKRINYNESVRQKIYARMISERDQIAERFRSEGAGEAARINGNKERELQTIVSKAYREIQSIKGDADAKATDIYARSYNQTPAAAELYDFVKTLDTYRSVIDTNTTLVLSTDSDLMGLIKQMEPNAR